MNKLNESLPAYLNSIEVESNRCDESTRLLEDADINAVADLSRSAVRCLLLLFKLTSLNVCLSLGLFTIRLHAFKFSLLSSSRITSRLDCSELSQTFNFIQIRILIYLVI